MLTALALGLGLYLAYGVLMVVVHPRFLYPFAADAADLPGLERREVEVPGAEPVGVLVGGPLGAPTVLFFMGNAGALGLFGPWLELHLAAGRRVVAMQYRGGGGLPGRPSEARLKADALAVHDWAAGQGPVLLHGFSLGAGLALHVAARRDVAGVILEAPFASACRLMARASALPACLLPVQRWNGLADVPAIAAPVLILHGDADEVISVAEGRRLAEAFSDEGRPAMLEVVPGGRHGDLPDHPGYRAALAGFAAAQAP